MGYAYLILTSLKKSLDFFVCILLVVFLARRVRTGLGRVHNEREGCGWTGWTGSQPPGTPLPGHYRAPGGTVPAHHRGLLGMGAFLLFGLQGSRVADNNPIS